MTLSDHTLEQTLGRRLRGLRETRGLSLRALAAQADVTASFLSQLERGLCSPSLSTLRQLAISLEVPVFQLLLETENTSPVVRSDERITVEMPGSPASYELLSTGSAQRVEMLLVRVSQPDVNLVRRLATPTEECLYVVSGTLAIEFAGEQHLLGAGDSVTYHGRSLTSLMAVGEQELVYIAAVTPPSF